MFDVLKVFYATHYNIAALAILLFLLAIFLFSKKNIPVGLGVLAACLILNVFVFKRTDGKVWTITIDPPAQPAGEYGGYVQPIVEKFSVRGNWSFTDDKGEVHHWCWVETYWDKFANIDLVGALWGGNASKKMQNASESRSDMP